MHRRRKASLVIQALSVKRATPEELAEIRKLLVYSRTLAHLEQLRASAPVLAVAANGGSLLLRIQRLLAVPERRAPLHSGLLVGSLAAALLAVVLGAARQAEATGAASEPSAQQAQAPPASEEVRPFEAGMTCPMRLSGDIPRLPDSMLPALSSPGASILFIVECTLSVEGVATDCEIVTPRPELKELEVEVLRAMATSRYKPVTDQGRPIAVRYVFNIRLTPPKP
jgi:hypothetical protein